jgi:uncharacterized membrane protein (UPF0127 family)
VNWRKHIVTFLIVFFLVGMLLFGSRRGCGPGAGGRPLRPPDARIVELTVADAPQADGRLSPHSYVIQAEAADTKEKRQRGLAGRPGLEPGYGMLYVYEESLRPEFSEAGTPFPLSVAFIKEDGTIAELVATEANDAARFTSQEPIKYVLEIRPRWFEDRGLGVGSRLRLPEGLTGQPKPFQVGAETPVTAMSPLDAPAAVAGTPE